MIAIQPMQWSRLQDLHDVSYVKAGSIAYRTAEQDRTRRLKREGPLGVLVR